ncbi:hypothetical protein D5S17_30945 [Pseudonocardiaceae bacterium YIM PH 21723]|nr:hypothetical protein D5S17_30945 [Pseudonocardiaceae bacterium YIM PH 21723]
MVTLIIAVTGVLLLVLPGGSPPPAPEPPASNANRPAPPGISTGEPAGDGKIPAIGALLRSRAEAVRQRNRAAFLDTVDPQADAAFRERQAELFDNLRDVPLKLWDYRLNADETNEVEHPSQQRRGSEELWSPRVDLLYQLTGADPQPTSRPQGMVFSRRGDRWYLMADAAQAAPGLKAWRGPWDFGPVRASATAKGVVLSHDSNAEVADRVRGELDSAVDAVTSVWGDRWSGRVAVVLPESTEELQSLVGPEFAVDSIAAVAIADRVDGGKQTADGQRVVLNPTIAARLSPSALRVVLRHEIGHVATRGVTVDGSPLWLLEGFADYIGYKDSGIPMRQAAPELAKNVQRPGFTAAELPADADLHNGGTKLDFAYQRSWSFVVYLSQLTSEQRVVQIYRQIASKGKIDQDIVDGILRDATGKGHAELRDGWTAFLQQNFR